MPKKKNEPEETVVYKCDVCMEKQRVGERGEVSPLREHPDNHDILQCPHCGKKFTKP